MEPKENKCALKLECGALYRRNECIYFKCRDNRYDDICRFQAGNLRRFCINPIANVNACMRYAEEMTGNKFIVDDKLETTN